MQPINQPTYGTYRWICHKLGEYMNWTAEWNAWDHEQENEADDIIECALMQFYYPPPVEMMPSGHSWSFLRPLGRITTSSGQRTQDLPEDFERFDGKITYVNDSNDYPPIQITSEQRIRQMAYQQDYKSHPVWAASIQVMTDGSAEQQQQVTFHPTPDSTYELEFRYVALPKKLSDTYPVPLGGRMFAEVIMASVLAEAEIRRDGKEGPMMRRWRDKLTTAVAHDMKRGAEIVGYNADTSTLSNNRMHKDIRKVRDFLYNNVTLTSGGSTY